jgi:hypothetical protein
LYHGRRKTSKKNFEDLIYVYHLLLICKQVVVYGLGLFLFSASHTAYIDQLARRYS